MRNAGVSGRIARVRFACCHRNPYGSVSRPDAETVRLAFLAAVLTLGIGACDRVEGNVALGAAGVTLYGARTPAHEVEQIYYLGSFDPHEQLPPTIYRVRVHGQASVLSGTKFASGWVPAPVVDSLGTDFRFDVNDPNRPAVKLTKGELDLVKLDSQRRLMQFGPEGIREAPKDHRLVIVMGASPEAFFEGVNSALGRISALRQEQSGAGLRSRLFDDLIEMRGHRTRLDSIGESVEARIKDAEKLK